MTASPAPVASLASSTPSNPPTLADLRSVAVAALKESYFGLGAERVHEQHRAWAILCVWRDSTPPSDEVGKAAQAAVQALWEATGEGVRVQVSEVWAGGRNSFRAWIPGYRFVAFDADGETVLVAAVAGFAAGVPVRFRASDVRFGGKAYQTDARVRS